ncbi:hypothetical protein EJB05_06100, partial [Eragrostis curvula]
MSIPRKSAFEHRQVDPTVSRLIIVLGREGRQRGPPFPAVGNKVRVPASKNPFAFLNPFRFAWNSRCCARHFATARLSRVCSSCSAAPHRRRHRPAGDLREQAMAGQAESPVNDPISPHLVSGAFVQQYYHILHNQPEQVHKFYQDSSILARPEPNGTMVSVTTLADINETIMSTDFRNCLIEIETADAQLSHKDGVLIVVTGSLSPSEDVCRKFTQSFFLAPQESGGYFVLNDVFRFISEKHLAVINQVVTRENESSQNAISAIPASETYSALPKPTAAEKTLNSDHVTVESNVEERQVINPSVNGSAVEYNVTTEPPVQVVKEDPKRAPVAAPRPPAPAQRDVTKKSYASIVKDMKEGPPAVPAARTTSSVPKNKPPPKPVTKDVEGPVKPSAKPVTKDVEGPVKPSAKPVTKDVEGPVKPSAKPARDNETTASDGIGAESNSSRNEHGYSIFIRNLPFYANIELVREEFKKFGAVKPDCVQVVQKASPVRIGANNVFIEKKNAPTKVTRRGAFPRGYNGEGGRFQAGSGVYHGDNFGGQGGGYGNNANYRGGDNFNHGNGRENYNSRNDGRENYNRRGNAGENYSHRNEGGVENYNRRNDGGENYNRRGDFGENYSRRNDGGENYNRRGKIGENYNRRNDGGENYNHMGDGGENNNRRSNVDENYKRRNDGGESYKRGGDGGENYNRRNEGGENYNRRNDGGENYNRRNDGGENYSRRNDGENFNRRNNFRNQNEFSGGRGHGPPPGNGYNQNGNGFHPPRPVQNGNGRSARVNGPKQPPGAA